jgi:hypothetical protein
VRVLTRRHRGIPVERMIADLAPILRGWAGYFGFSQSLKMYLFPVSARQTWLQRHCLGPVLAATLKPGWSDVGRVEGQGARQQCRMIAVPE